MCIDCLLGWEGRFHGGAPSRLIEFTTNRGPLCNGLLMGHQ